MKKVLLFLFLLPLFCLGQGTITNPWVRSGNTLINNLSYLGTNNNTSLVFKTNSGAGLGYLKLDSLNYVNWKLPSTLGWNNFQISRWINSGFDYPVIYFGVKEPTVYNYLVLSDSSNVNFNAPYSLFLKTKNITFLSASVGSGSTAVAITVPATSQATINNNVEFRHMTFTGNSVGLPAGSAVTLFRENLWTAATYSGNGAATITNAVANTWNKPTIGTNLTVSNNSWAGEFIGDLNVTTNVFVGAALTLPAARIHLAAGNATLPAIKCTNQTAVSSPAAGEMYYTTAPGFAFQGNMTTSGNATVVGTMSVGSTATVGAGLRVVGALSVTTTFSAGTTSTLAGNTRIGGTTAPNGALSVTGAVDVSTTFSCGTTSTLVGKSRIGGTTAPSATLDVTGNILATTDILSSGVTNGIGYATGSGSTVTQASSRTTGVTINAITGAITLVSAAGSITYQSFTVTNSAVAATDVIIVNQKSGTDKNIILVTAVAAGSFQITFATTAGVTVEQPVFNYAVIKGKAN